MKTESSSCQNDEQTNNRLILLSACRNILTDFLASSKMIIRVVNDTIEIEVEQEERNYVVVCSFPDMTVDYTLRRVSENSFEVSSFEVLEPFNQMQIMRTLKKLKEQCQNPL
jgi:hypothetical protein